MVNCHINYFACPGLMYWDEIKNEHRERTNPEIIINGVCKVFGITEKQLKSNKRIHELVVARQIAIYLIKFNSELSMVSIGKEFGGRDHTTVIHSIKAIRDYLFTKNEYVMDKMNRVENYLSEYRYRSKFDNYLTKN